MIPSIADRFPSGFNAYEGEGYDEPTEEELSGEDPKEEEPLKKNLIENDDDIPF